MRFLDVDTGRLLGLEYKLICHFKLAADMVGSGYKDVYRRESGRCCSLPFFLKFYLSRFSFYIKT